MHKLALLALLASACLPLVVTRSAHAEQFVLVDATFSYTWDDAMNAMPNKSHYYVNDKNFLNTQRPKNWVSPVDFRNGTLHVRTEVFEKPPGDQQVGWTLCYIANAGDYGCADTSYYKSTGVFDRETKMTDFWQNDKIVWEQGVKQVDLIYAINDSGSGHITNYPALKDLTTPTRVRITMVQVSAGSTYDASIIPSMGMGGAGAGGAAAGGDGGMGGMLSSMGGSVAGNGGYGGLLDMAMGGAPSPTAGAPAAGSAAAGAAPTAGGGTGAGGAPAAAPTTSTSTDAGCNFVGVEPDWAGLCACVAAASALTLARRTRRLLRR